MAFTLLDANAQPQTFASTVIGGVHYPSHQVYPQVAGGGLIAYRSLNLQPQGAGESTVYQNLPSPFPYSMTSQNFEAGSIVEFGELVALAGTDRHLGQVTVTMETWAYFSKYYPSHADAGAGWTANITLNIYAVDTSGANPQPGTKIATLTQAVLVPWRAEPDATACPSTTKWVDPDGICRNGLAFPVTFDLSSQNVVLPDQIIFSIAFTTQSSGAPAGPINDLAVGVQNALSTGSSPLAPELYLNGYNNSAYADGGAGGINVFRLDVGGTHTSIGARIMTSDGSPTSLIKTGPGQVYGWHCSNHSNGPSAGWRYIKLYDKATAPTESDKPILTLGVPSGEAISFNSDLGIQYMSGLGVRGTVHMNDTDATAPGPGDLLVNIHYI